MRSTWTESRLDDFAQHTNRRFDAVDLRFDTLERRMDDGFREVRSEIGALQRTIIVAGGAMFAALLGVIATQL